MLKHFIQKILVLFSSAKPAPEAVLDVLSHPVSVLTPEPIPEPVSIIKKPETKTKSQLLAMTKDKLEEYGRTIGIELDKRKAKNVLVEQLLNHQMSLKGE